ncbi:uncharacterized protein LOC127285795 isoform X3 [Leptopilina boulardi]|uniref:uncharacterized protein LOC127285795 isoform X3 n=1 Tax=Leptopilina boulardi TaxID=63433 RepID=UPI0021F698C3|nr:uncharacterized protein LOC127285795 isoform X3 [Leptopilina boulardi]
MALSSAGCSAVFASASPGVGDSFKVPVKEERPDEAEIRELAAKMVEAHKAKMAPSVATLGVQRPSGGGGLQQGSLQGMLFFNNNTNTLTLGTTQKRATDSSQSTNKEGKVPLDDESQRGRFGWVSFDETHIPYIFRAGEKFCAVRILESKLLNKYLSYLHSDIYSCTCIRSYYITEAESKLLNEINSKHCESQFGREQFTSKDLVVRLADAKEFYAFLDVCYTKLTASNRTTPSDKCGFIRINKESVVPYTVKDGLKYVPLFYFEGETDNLKLKAEKLEGWDLSYLKFCCKVQGIRNELFASETCSVISLSDIKSYFPPGTGFEDYWPSKVMDSQLIVNSKGGGGGGGWTKQPATPPAPKPVQNNVAKNTIVRAQPMQNMIQRPNATIQRVTQLRTPISHSTHSSSSSSSSPTISSVRSNTIAQPISQRDFAALNAVQTAVNGWSGLVSTQPTFQAALVSQANQIIRMPNSALSTHNQMTTASKTYSQQSRSRGGGGGAAQYPGVYPVTTMQSAVHVQPPPLIRATQSNQSNIGYPTYGEDDWVSPTYTTPTSMGVPNAAAPYPQMLGLSAEQVQALMPAQTSPSTLLPHPQRHTPPVHNSSHNKYPPPLIPVNGSSNSSSGRDSRGRKPLIPIAETHTSGNCQVPPYQVQKALVEDKLVPCINLKPFVYQELLMTLPDFVQQYFPASDINSCRQVLTDVLGIDLYQGNRLQMEMLMKANKCSSLNEELPLIQVRSVMKFMPQMKYMFNRSMIPNSSATSTPTPTHSSEEHPSKKRQRTS